MFEKILIANRGEIAVRIAQTCREMGIRSVAVYSRPDRGAKHVRVADEAYSIGPARAQDSYLNIERILSVAAHAGADAIHPGYGFLSENAEFAAACRHAGVKFIGPPPDAIRAMGVKTRARELVAAAGVPVVPGTTTPVRDAAQAASAAEAVGFPIMLKAAAGGGGKGMRLVPERAELPGALRQAQGEARRAFGDDAVYIEKAVLRPRHVEVQVLADEHGAAIHLGERECSLQRRHQKILEETPSPLVAANPEVRDRLCSAAVAAAQACGYANAGTVEFLMDAACRFYFLEMNTRLQVEHPITELVTGLDLVREQIRVAAGHRLRLRQHDVQPRGHAMECRVYAEDPEADFMPSPGRIDRLRWPTGPGIRVDSGAEEGWTVPLEYDPLIAKLCVWAPSRPRAIARLRYALRETTVGGIATTVGFFRSLCEDARFLAGEIDTSFLDNGPPRTAAPSLPTEGRLAAAIAVLHAAGIQPSERGTPRAAQTSRWKELGRLAPSGAAS